MHENTMSDQRRAFGFRLVLIARRWRQAIDAELQAAGLSDATWRPLIHLHKRGDGMRQKDLAASLGMDGSGLVRLLDVLAERGLLERREDPADGRAKTLHLTGDGHRLVEHVQQLITAFEGELLSGFTDAEVVALMQAFDRIEDQIGLARAQERDRT
ncbi:MarR family winged helix-turn-helix transcriptional regulator [Azospirillum soli]|uniref:MarR family winged helix-turn-helix transcriptional regulator n=1 Tax=Azospirillum soli TaxID=1304799 RepID=UPI001FE2D901|nr:MarR family transcriptional regulator [Azospirillum soli]MBP2312780.1 MarR family transcriptional regulator for hemolysin [Azospirillum soli]